MSKSRLIRNTAVNYVSHFVSMAAAFILLPFILKGLGDAGFGVYKLVLAIAGYMALLQIGVGTTAVRFIAAHVSRGETEEINRFLSNTLVFYMGIGLIVGAQFLVMGAFFLDLFDIPPDLVGETGRAFLVAGLFSVALWPLSLFRKVLEGLQAYTITAGWQIIFTFIRTGVVLHLLLRGEGLVSLLLVFFIIQFLQHSIYLVIVVRRIVFLRLSLKLISRAAFKRIFAFGGMLFAIQLCSMAMYQTDRLVLALVLPVAALALYEGPWSVHELMRTVNGVFGAAVIPAASALHAREDHDSLRELFLRGSKYGAIIIMPLVLAALILAPDLIRHWLGEAYLPAAAGLRVFVAYWLLQCTLSMTGPMLIAMGRLRFVLAYALTIMLINVGLSITLVLYLHDYTGVIWGTVIPPVLAYPFFLIKVLRMLNIRFMVFVKRVFLPVYPAALLPAAAGLGLIYWDAPGNLVRTLGYGSIMLILYWVAVFYTGLDRVERSELSTAFRGRRP